MADVLRKVSLHHNLYLIGLMGVGKTTIGRALAKKLDKQFIDTDHEIEIRTGVSISVIFDIEGESGFRAREANVIRSLTEKPSHEGIVLATGGGAVLKPENRARLSNTGTVIYLRASIDQLFARIHHNTRRPLLHTPNTRQTLEALAVSREPLYQEIADITIDAEKMNTPALVHQIISSLAFLPVQEEDHRVVHIALGKRGYPIVIGSSQLHKITSYIPKNTATIAIITNITLAPLYLQTITQALRINNDYMQGQRIIEIILPDGEEYKNWHSIMRIFDGLLSQHCDRQTMLVALGGGVIGDLVGFVAATYMRGIAFIQIPTTLLAQVDSAIGGKTGINHPLGKNMIGAFYQPNAVITDTNVLTTLPDRELIAGLAEIIKYGVIMDVAFFEWLENHIHALKARDSDALIYAIGRSCELKAKIIQKDEKEEVHGDSGRVILNFGHTFGHAIETGAGVGQWRHGEAVGCGMVMAASLSQQLGFIDSATTTRITALIRTAGLPVLPPQWAINYWMSLMQMDKKKINGKIQYVLLNALGAAFVTEASEEAVAHMLLTSGAEKDQCKTMG